MMKGTKMNIQVAQMYVNLCASALALGVLSGLDDSRAQTLKEIATNRHCGDGYFSWDGMLDDLTELVGDVDLASDILNEC
jgi:hypothetical protein